MRARARAVFGSFARFLLTFKVQVTFLQKSTKGSLDYVKPSVQVT